LDSAIAVFIDIGLALCALALVRWFLGRRNPKRLANDILDPNARERLVQDTMRISGCSRQEAIRKVLCDHVRRAGLFK